MYVSDYVHIPIKTILFDLLKELKLDFKFEVEKTHIKFKKIK